MCGGIFYQAKKEAEKSTFRFRLGAIVLHKNKVVAKGYNKIKTHPKLDHYTIHAECDALLKAAKGDTLVVVRILRNGEFACSKPCEKCLKYIKKFGIKKIYYLDWDSDLQEMRL